MRTAISSLVKSGSLLDRLEQQLTAVPAAATAFVKQQIETATQAVIAAEQYIANKEDELKKYLSEREAAALAALQKQSDEFWAGLKTAAKWTAIGVGGYFVLKLLLDEGVKSRVQTVGCLPPRREQLRLPAARPRTTEKPWQRKKRERAEREARR